MRFACAGGTRLAFLIHDSNSGDRFSLGRNYTLAVTETVRRQNYRAALFENIRGQYTCQEREQKPHTGVYEATGI